MLLGPQPWWTYLYTDTGTLQSAENGKSWRLCVLRALSVEANRNTQGYSAAWKTEPTQADGLSPCKRHVLGDSDTRRPFSE